MVEFNLIKIKKGLASRGLFVCTLFLIIFLQGCSSSIEKLSCPTGHMCMKKKGEFRCEKEDLAFVVIKHPDRKYISRCKKISAKKHLKTSYCDLQGAIADGKVLTMYDGEAKPASFDVEEMLTTTFSMKNMIKDSKLYSCSR